MANVGTKQSIIRAIRALYEAQEWAQMLFDHWANFKRNPKETAVSQLTRQLNVTTTEATAYAKELAEAGCGKYVVGRKGNESRIQWTYTCSSLGQAATGQTDDLVGFADEADGAVEEEPPAAQVPDTLTIAQAKEALARTFGVSPDQIEIIIKG